VQALEPSKARGGKKIAANKAITAQVRSAAGGISSGCATPQRSQPGLMILKYRKVLMPTPAILYKVVCDIVRPRLGVRLLDVRMANTSDGFDEAGLACKGSSQHERIHRSAKAAIRATMRLLEETLATPPRHPQANAALHLCVGKGIYNLVTFVADYFSLSLSSSHSLHRDCCIPY